MRLMRLLTFLLLPLLVLTGVLSAPAWADPNRNFEATLTGAEEVPPVNTEAAGTAKFHLSNDGMELRFVLDVRDIENALFAHIHVGARGTNGPVVAFLYHGPDDPNCNVESDRFRCQGTITAADLRGPLAGQPLSALIERMRAGMTYANAHTTQHPGGETRGQIEEH